MIKSSLRRALPWEARAFLRKVFYFGLKFKCSVCGARVRCFRSAGFDFPVLKELDVVGGKCRAEDTCPVCLSNSRTRLVHHYLWNELDIASSRLRMLHIAPEYGLYLTIRSLGNIDYLPADLSPKRYAHIAPIKHMNVTEIGCPDDSFDAIICNHVLEHVGNDRLAMTELFRVLGPGGWAILQVPISRLLEQTLEDPSISDPSERERRFGQKSHVRIYGSDYVERLTNVGFAVEVFDPGAHWEQETIEALKIDPKEKVFVAHKDKSAKVGE